MADNSASAAAQYSDMYQHFSPSNSDSQYSLSLKKGESIRYTILGVTLDSQLILEGSCRGVLVVTNWRFAFFSRQLPKRIECPLTCVETITLSKKSPHTLSMCTRDLRKIRLVFPDEDICKSIKDFFTIFVSPEHVSYVFAFAYGACVPNCNDKRDFDYDTAHMIKEYARLGVTQPGSYWRISNANETYNLCPTYPPLLVVPASVSDNHLFEVAKFRGNKRFPILVWKQPNGRCAIVRSSQPLVGTRRNRSEHDEAYLKAIQACNPTSQCLYILDARPKAFSVANMANGGGYEFEENYKNCRIEFLGIDNIHAMRESHNQLFKLINSREMRAGWRSGLDSTGWLKHILLIFEGVERILGIIEKEKASVLVHCSDGWDRTNQLCALAELCLDPHARTLLGFQTLILKHWTWMGHKFTQRTFSPNERAPIFLQFVDCVHQLLTQFPTAFEFNTKLLVKLVDAVHDCRFGTFLGDYHKQRIDLDIPTSTASFWWHVTKHNRTYKNPYYTPVNETLWPIVTDRKLKFWSEFFCRYDYRLQNRNEQMTPYSPVKDALNSRISSVEAKLRRLQQQVVALPSNEISTKLLDEILQEVDQLRAPSDSDSSSDDEETRITKDDDRMLIASAYATIRRRPTRADLKQTRPQWMHDDQSKVCCYCRVRIRKGTRHHCRNCGLLFCGNCTTKRIPIPSMGYTNAVRVCDTCALKLRRESAAKHLEEMQQNTQWRRYFREGP